MLADKLGYDKRQIVRAVKKLEEEGLITVHRRSRKPNVYHVRDSNNWNKEYEFTRELPVFNKFPLPDSYYESCIGEEVIIPPLPDEITYVHVNFS
jgi:DNA-binding transcriptional ArsR family regulator